MYVGACIVLSLSLPLVLLYRFGYLSYHSFLSMQESIVGCSLPHCCLNVFLDASACRVDPDRLGFL